MAEYIQQGQSRTFRLRPADPMATPTATVKTRTGVLLEAPAATPDPTSTTVTAAANDYTVNVDDGSTMAAGRLYRVTDPAFGSADVEASVVDGDVVRFVEPLPGAPSVGATVVGLEVEVTLGAASVDDLAIGNILDVRAAGVQSARLVFHVVAHPYVGPVTARHVRDWFSKFYSAEAQDEQRNHDVADAANRMIHGRLITSGVYVSAYWDPDALADVGYQAMLILLAREGFYSSTRDTEQYLRETKDEYELRLGDLLKSAQPADKNNDGKVDDEEITGVFTVKMQR